MAAVMFNRSKPRPTFQSGFADNRHESDYPHQWDDLRGLWLPLLGPQGNKLYDFSGFHNDGSFTNFNQPDTWVVSEDVEALFFDGGNDRVVIPSRAPIRPTNITVLVWFKPDTGTIDSYAEPFAQPWDTGGTWNSPFLSWNCGRSSTSNVNDYRITVNSSNSWSWNGTINLWNSEEWVCTALTYDGETGRGYVNGVLDAQNTSPTGNLGYDSSFPSLVFGSQSDDAPGSFFGGHIAQARIYGHAKTIEQIEEIVNDPEGIVRLRPRVFGYEAAAPAPSGHAGSLINGPTVKSKFEGLIPA